MRQQKIETEQQCLHHWLIDPAMANKSQGYCCRCGAKKEFTNRYVGKEATSVFYYRNWARKQKQ